MAKEFDELEELTAFELDEEEYDYTFKDLEDE